LVTVRAFDPAQGKYDVPGGFLRIDEDPCAGLRREIAEELGIEVDVAERDFVQAVPHVYGDDGDWVLSLGFVARYIGGEPVPADDVAAVKWVDADELDDLDWAWEHDKELVRKALLGEH
jgi:8-oxo-dGTP diphosphatase